MRRHLWWIVFAGLVGGSYLFLQQPQGPGAAPRGTFRWWMLWAPEAEMRPSDRLAPYMGRGVDRLFGPLDKKFEAPPTKELNELAAKFRAEAGSAARSRAPVYQAAIVVADGLTAGLEIRRKTTLALAEARANTLSFLDPITGRMTPNRTFLEKRIKEGWTADAAVRRKRINDWYAVLQQRERAEGMYGVIGK